LSKFRQRTEHLFINYKFEAVDKNSLQTLNISTPQHLNSSTPKPNSFTLRVYGIYIEKDRLLVSDEYIYGKYVTKFPGGGLIFGEGTIDGLKREMVEETGQEVEVMEHFYTTDFFVPSAFDPTKQVISIYYLIKFNEPIRLKIAEKKFDFAELKDDAQSFRWIKISELTENDFTLPIDKVVGNMIKGILHHRRKTYLLH
jgi:ADP-ribose pyrophosphatase YjhB (NUDIX family)